MNTVPMPTIFQIELFFEKLPNTKIFLLAFQDKSFGLCVPNGWLLNGSSGRIMAEPWSTLSSHPTKRNILIYRTGGSRVLNELQKVSRRAESSLKIYNRMALFYSTSSNTGTCFESFAIIECPSSYLVGYPLINCRFYHALLSDGEANFTIRFATSFEWGYKVRFDGS